MRADDLIRTADSYVVTYEDLGVNHNRITEEFADIGGPAYEWCRAGQPWCAMSVSVWCQRNGFPLLEPAVISIERLAKQGWHGMTWSTVPVRGSAVCFDFGGVGNPANMHTGLVYEVLGDGRYKTIEGNYRDRCDRWLRDMRYVRGFAVFPFASPPLPPPPPEDEVTDADLVKIHAAIRDEIRNAFEVPTGASDREFSDAFNARINLLVRAAVNDGLEADK